MKSVFGALTVAFVVLKLCKIITWSWLWVLSPLWVPVAIYLIVVAFLWLATFILSKIGGH